jgi:hypothetical protein
MTLKTLADVRELVKHLPKDHRKKIDMAARRETTQRRGVR